MSVRFSEDISHIVMESRGETSCEITLDDVVLDDLDRACDEGEVYVGSTRVPCDQDNRVEGFWLPDNTTLEITGSYCRMLKEAVGVRVAFPCDVLK